MEKITWILTLTSFVFGSLNFFKVKSTAGLPLMLFKVFGAALAPLIGFLGLLGSVLGFFVDSPWAMTIGILGALLSAYHIWIVTAPHNGFEQAFGPDWEDRLRPFGCLNPRSIIGSAMFLIELFQVPIIAKPLSCYVISGIH
jgi:hypothetical protein